MPLTLRQPAGSLLIVGLEGPSLTPLERAWLKLIRPAGIILFRRNIENATQTRTLLKDSAAYCVDAHLRCVDLEGGLVDRLRDAVAGQPSAQAVARTGKPALMQKHGDLIARECLAFGFNTTLTPVLDLGLPASASVMGSRTAAPDAAGVIQYTRAFLTGLASRGITGCAKHFPGLGGGTLDSHLATPSIERTWKQLWSEDLAPYRVLRKELPMVMVSHAAYPQTRSGSSPATVSPFWIATVLQKRIGYHSLVFSDDMEMGGILKQMPIEEAAIGAVRAGIHLIEICRSPELILRTYEALLHEAERSAAFRKILLARARSSASLRAKQFSAPFSRQISPSQLVALTVAVQNFARTIESNQPQ
jgi:beta-N-acetylhexosaminidase